MQRFPAFFYVIKTNFGKTIAEFIDSKYESTRDMIIEDNGGKFRGKLTNK